MIELSEHGDKLSYDNTNGTKSDKIGPPHIPTEQVADSMLSSKINKFDYFTQASKFVLAYQDSRTWEEFKSRLHQIRSLLTKDGKNLDVTNCPEICKDSFMQTWINSYPNDKKLLLWQQYIDNLIAKYPKRK